GTGLGRAPGPFPRTTAGIQRDDPARHGGGPPGGAGRHGRHPDRHRRPAVRPQRQHESAAYRPDRLNTAHRRPRWADAGLQYILKIHAAYTLEPGDSYRRLPIMDSIT